MKQKTQTPLPSFGHLHNDLYEMEMGIWDCQPGFNLVTQVHVTGSFQVRKSKFVGFLVQQL